MKGILIFLIITSFSILLYIKKNIKIEETIPFTFIGIILVLFIFGLFGFLKLGVYIIIISALVALIYSGYLFYKSKIKKKILYNIFSPAVVFFIVLYIGLLFYHKGRLLINWDEFSHWGDVVKVMFTINDFSTSKLSLSAFQSYLPGMSIFQYFFQAVNGNFNEGYLFVSHQLLTISMFMPFLSKYKWKNILPFFISIIIIILSLIVFNYEFYKTIYIDCFLGVMFGTSLTYAYMYKDSYDKSKIIKMSLLLFMLTLTKDIGLLLAFICIFEVFINFVIKSFKEKKVNIKSYLPVFIFLIVIFVSYFVWQLKIKISGASTPWINPLDLKFIVNSLLGIGNGYGITVRNNFINAFINYKVIQGYLDLNCVAMIVFTSFFFMYLYETYSKKKYRLNDKLFFLICILSFIGYCFMLLVLYLWKFSEYEAIKLASWNRYIYGFLQGILCLIVMIIISNTKNKIANNKILIILFVIVLLSIKYETFIYYRNRGIQKTIEIRTPYINASEKIKKIFKNKKYRLYFISQNSNGSDYWIFKFSTRESFSYINNGEFNWSIGEKYYDGDLWTKNISPENWLDELTKEYDYVYLYHVDDKFINKYGYLFDYNSIENNQLYRINKKQRFLEFVS